MKIVMIGPVYPYTGGISNYTTCLYNQLKKNNDVKLFSYSMQYPKILMKREQKNYEDDLLKIENVEYVLNTANPFSCINLAKKINKIKPDLVIFQWLHPYFAPCFSIICNHLKNVKKLFICHNVFPHERFILDKFLTKLTLKKGNYFITHSVSDANDLKSIIPNAKIKIGVHPSYNFFNINNYSTEDGRKLLNDILVKHNLVKIPSENRILLFFGLVREYKGLKYLLNALKIIQNENIKLFNNITLVIAGNFAGSREKYEIQIKELGIKENIRIIDEHIETKEVEKYFSSCDVVCLPYESATQSGVIQIAYSFEKPVIATNVGGLPDVVINEKTGYIVEKNNPKAFADAIIKYLENDNENVFIDEIKKEQYKFDWERMEENILHLVK